MGMAIFAGAAAGVNHSSNSYSGNNDCHSTKNNNNTPKSREEIIYDIIRDDEIRCYHNIAYYSKNYKLYYWNNNKYKIETAKWLIDKIINIDPSVKIYGLNIPKSIENDFATPENYLNNPDNRWFRSCFNNVKISFTVMDRYLVVFNYGNAFNFKNAYKAIDIIQVEFFDFECEEDYKYAHYTCSSVRRYNTNNKIELLEKPIAKQICSLSPLTTLYKCKCKINGEYRYAYFYSTLYDDKTDSINFSIFDIKHIGSSSIETFDNIEEKPKCENKKEIKKDPIEDQYADDTISGGAAFFALMLLFIVFITLIN